MTTNAAAAARLGVKVRAAQPKQPRPTPDSLFNAFTRAQPDRLDAYGEAHYRLGRAIALIPVVPALYREQINLALAELDQAHRFDVARAAELFWFGAFGVTTKHTKGGD